MEFVADLMKDVEVSFTVEIKQAMHAVCMYASVATPGGPAGLVFHRNEVLIKIFVQAHVYHLHPHFEPDV